MPQKVHMVRRAFAVSHFMSYNSLLKELKDQ